MIHDMEDVMKINENGPVFQIEKKKKYSNKAFQTSQNGY